MPEFDQMLDAVRGDCDTPVLAAAADLRRAGARRTVTHRALGGAVALLVLGGAVTGYSVLRPGAGAIPVAPAATITSTAITTTATTPPPTALPPPPAATATPSVAAPHSTAPSHSATPGHSATHAHTSSAPPPAGTTTPARTAACTAAEFGPNVGNQEDDAAGIVGFDLTFTYEGTAACKLAQPAHLYYTNAAGHLVAFPPAPGAAGTPAITVKPHHKIVVSVFVHDIVGGGTCQNPHSYIDMFARIGGHDHALPNVTVTFPCSGAATTAWSLG